MLAQDAVWEDDICPVSQLCSEINTCIRISAYETKLFLPESSFNRLIDNPRIKQCLPDTTSLDLLDFVYKSARRLFTIIVYLGSDPVELHDDMVSFKDAGVTDGNLPIPDIRTLECHRQKNPQCLSHNPSLRLFHNRKRWKSHNFQSFHESQFKFLAPVFTKDPECFVHVLQPYHPWPITSLDKVSKEGYFGTVRKAGLRADHQQIDPEVRIHSSITQHLPF